MEIEVVTDNLGAGHAYGRATTDVQKGDFVINSTTPRTIVLVEQYRRLQKSLIEAQKEILEELAEKKADLVEELDIIRKFERSLK